MLNLTAHRDSLAQLCMEVHASVALKSEVFYDELRRKNYTTPTSYLELLRLYIDMLKMQQNILPLKIRKYKVGLQTLKETNEVVEKLKKQIIEFQPILEQSAKDNAALLVELEIKTKVANEVEAVVSKEAEQAQMQKDQVNDIKNECEQNLNEALPALKAAEQAVDSIDPKQLQEMKSFP